MNEATISHFKTGLLELQAERTQLVKTLAVIDAQISATREFIETWTSMRTSSPSESAVSVLAGVGAEPPPVRDVLMEIAETGRLFTFDEVMSRLRERGNTAQRDSVSSIISREPTIERGTKRGTYRLRRQDAETPTHEAGVSGSVNRSAVEAAWTNESEGGGNGDDHLGHDHHPAVALGDA